MATITWGPKSVDPYPLCQKSWGLSPDVMPVPLETWLRLR